MTGLPDLCAWLLAPSWEGDAPEIRRFFDELNSDEPLAVLQRSQVNDAGFLDFVGGRLADENPLSSIDAGSKSDQPAV